MIINPSENTNYVIRQMRQPPLKSTTEIILEEYVIRMSASGMKLAPTQDLPERKPKLAKIGENEVIEIVDDDEDEKEDKNSNGSESFRDFDDCRPETPVVTYADFPTVNAGNFLYFNEDVIAYDVEEDKAPSSPLLVPIRYVDYDIDEILHPTPNLRSRGRPRKHRCYSE